MELPDIGANRSKRYNLLIVARRKGVYYIGVVVDCIYHSNKGGNIRIIEFRSQILHLAKIIDRRVDFISLTTTASNMQPTANIPWLENIYVIVNYTDKIIEGYLNCVKLTSKIAELSC